MTHIQMLNLKEGSEDWYDDVILPFDRDVDCYHYIKTSEVDLELSKITSCFNDRYSGRSWLQALENLKRFTYKSDTLDFLKTTIIKARKVNNDITIFDHHRPIMARFLGLKTIKAKLDIYEKLTSEI